MKMLDGFDVSFTIVAAARQAKRGSILGASEGTAKTAHLGAPFS
jgi:hypothetical protein